MRKLKTVVFFALAIISYPVIAFEEQQDYPVEIIDQWQTVLQQDGILIEYKVQECNNLNVKNQVLVLFRYTNQTNSVKAINWSVKEFREGVCSNCSKLQNEEFTRSLTLSPNEVIEGDGTSKMDNRVYIFSHFIDLVPGMTNKKLTDFEFVNLNVQTIQIDSNDE